MSSHHELVGGCVLHVSITHLIYPVTEKVLGQIFDVYGVNDLCLLQQPTHLDVFVEFQSWHEASQARDALHGRCIYDGCCLMDIQHAAPSISVHRLPNSEPVVVDWDRVEVEPLASSLTPSASTPATSSTTITSTTICEVSLEVHPATIGPIVDKANDCEVMVALPAPRDALASVATNIEEDCKGKDIFYASAGCIIMAPTSFSMLCLRDDGDKRITHQVPMHGPTYCPPPSLNRSVCVSGVSRPMPWPSFLCDGDAERLPSSWPATQGIFTKFISATVKIWDPGSMLQSGSAFAFLRSCCLPWQQLVFHKFNSVCKATCTATYRWDPGDYCSLRSVTRNLEYMLVLIRNSDVVLDCTSLLPTQKKMFASTHMMFECPTAHPTHSNLEQQKRGDFIISSKDTKLMVVEKMLTSKPFSDTCWIEGYGWRPPEFLLVIHGVDYNTFQLIVTRGDVKVAQNMQFLTAICWFRFSPRLKMWSDGWTIGGQNGSLHELLVPTFSLTEEKKMHMIGAVGPVKELNYGSWVMTTTSVRANAMPLQRPQGSDLLSVRELQDVYGIAIMHVMPCVEALDVHVQGDLGGFLSTMNGEQEPNHTTRSWRMQRIGARGYGLIIGLDDLSTPWDPGIVALYELAVPVRSCLGDFNAEVGATNYHDVSTPLLGDKQCFAGTVV